MTPAKGTSEAELLRRNPFRNYIEGTPRAVPAAASPSETTAPLALSASTSASAPLTSKSTGIIVDPYPNLLAPPAAGKRPEKHMFKLDLLWNGGVESCIQESRARAMGLLGKKWAAPPTGQAVNVDFNENGSKTSKRFLSGASVPEPTVTINTRAAIDDVYGMFNSPTKTMPLQPMEEIKAPSPMDENAGSKRLPCESLHAGPCTC